jgi:chaperonin GroES
MVENDPDTSLRQYDKILFDPREAIPVEFDPDNRLFVVPLEKILAIFRKSTANNPPLTEPAPDSDTDIDSSSF